MGAADVTLAGLLVDHPFGEHLVAYKVPAAFHWIDELSLSEVAKVRRADLARTLAS